MGIEIDGHMIVGAFGGDITLPEGYNYMNDWADERGLDSCSLHYDAGCDETIYGYYVRDIPIQEIDEHWLAHIKSLGQKFLELTGLEATLYGSQNVW